MVRPFFLVVEETPSLAAAVRGLLEGEGHIVLAVRDAKQARALVAETAARPPRALIVASNTFRSETTRHWQRGDLAVTDLVLVGTRDPSLHSGGGLHVVNLPLVPGELLGLIRELLTGSSHS